MNASRCSPDDIRAARTGGFTILELLVTLGLIGLLMALLLPAVMNARGVARRMQCLNNLKNLGLAMINLAEVQGRFPPSGNFGKQGGNYHNWVVTLLPYIDQNPLHDKWDYNLPYNDPANLPLAETHIPVLACPEDITVNGSGDLSYAVNGGFGWTMKGVRQVRGNIDLNGDGTLNFNEGTPTDKEVYSRTGMFFIDNWPSEGKLPFHTFATLLDGASQTIMMADSVRAGYDPFASPHLPGNWANPLAWYTAFYVSGYVCKDLSCVPGNIDYSLCNSHQEPYAQEALNSALKQAEGDAPWASSFHVGGLHFCFADGHTKFISENIDGAVYAALISPQGIRLDDTPLAQRVVSGDSF